METLLKEQILKQARIIEDYQGNESEILGAEKGGKFHGFIAGAEWAIEKLEADKAELLEALEKAKNEMIQCLKFLQAEGYEYMEFENLSEVIYTIQKHKQ